MHEIKAHDIEPLQALQRIEYLPSSNLKNPHDFVLKFHFAQNDYFENSELVTYFHMITENKAVRVESSKILWKPRKDITMKEIKKKQIHKKTGESRMTTKTLERQSFFTFFKTIESQEKVEEEDDEEEEEVNEFIFIR